MVIWGMVYYCFTNIICDRFIYVYDVYDFISTMSGHSYW